MRKIFRTGLAVSCIAAMLIGCGQQGNLKASETLAANSTAATEEILESAAEKKVFEGAP